MLLSLEVSSLRPLPFKFGFRRQQQPLYQCVASLERKESGIFERNFYERNFHGERTRRATCRATQAVGRYDGSWDAVALGAALHVPLPAARALAASLDAAEELPRGVTIDEVAKRSIILQRELGLDHLQVARMLALQPAFLACHTATVRARAEGLAVFLSLAHASPDAPRDGPTNVGTSSARETTPMQSGAGVSTSTVAPKTAGTPEGLTRPSRRGQFVSAAVTATATAAPPLHPGPGVTGSRITGTGGLQAAGAQVQGDMRVGGGVMPQAALELIARQPAFLEIPIDQLFTRCAELAEILGVEPYDACQALTRMMPDELVRMLRAPQAVVQQSWVDLAAALASLDQPGLYGAMTSPGKTRKKARRVETAVAVSRRQKSQGQWQAAQSGQSGEVVVFPASVERAAQRMVLLCPKLLMLPPDWVRASALHLREVLRLSPSGLQRLMARSPRLLLLSKRHREDALRALMEELLLGHEEDAARLVSQQPNLLKWTPEGLRNKLAEMARALGLSCDDMARLCRNQPALLAMSSQSLATKLEVLQETLKLPDMNAARQLTRRQPGLLTMSSSTLERKVRLLAHGLGLTNSFIMATRPPADVVPGLVQVPSAANASDATKAAASAPEATNSANILHRMTVSSSAAATALRAQRGTALQTVLQLVVAEPTLLTMSVEAMPRRLEYLAEALGATTLHDARALVLKCPRLLLMQRPALHHRLQELAWGLDAPVWAVKRLILARPWTFFRSLTQLRTALARAQAAGAGRGVHGRRMQVAAALETLASDNGEMLNEGAGEEGRSERVRL